MAWRPARSLTVLKNEVNLAYPKRPTGMDGTIGDTAHSSRVSDHNPNKAGVVCALDLTEWVVRGVEMNDVLAEFLRSRKDPRIKYVISDGRMFSSYDSVKNGRIVRHAWEWGPYSGPNAHTKHVHVSVHKNYDDTKPWGFKKAGPATVVPRQVLPVIALTKKDEEMEILNPRDSDTQYIHVIGKFVIAMTDLSIESEYKKHYPEIHCNEAWVKVLQNWYGQD